MTDKIDNQNFYQNLAGSARNMITIVEEIDVRDKNKEVAKNSNALCQTKTTDQQKRYNFINGWNSNRLYLFVCNSSFFPIRIRFIWIIFRIRLVFLILMNCGWNDLINRSVTRVSGSGSVGSICAESLFAQIQQKIFRQKRQKIKNRALQTSRTNAKKPFTWINLISGLENVPYKIKTKRMMAVTIKGTIKGSGKIIHQIAKFARLSIKLKQMISRRSKI